MIPDSVNNFCVRMVSCKSFEHCFLNRKVIKTEQKDFVIQQIDN